MVISYTNLFFKLLMAKQEKISYFKQPKPIFMFNETHFIIFALCNNERKC